MRKTLVIAVREYLATVRTKGFIISLVVMPILMGGAIIAQKLLGDQLDTRPQKYAVVDRSPGRKLATLLQQAAQERTQLPKFEIEAMEPLSNAGEQRFELSERVRHRGDNQLRGFLEIAADIYDAPPSVPNTTAGEAAPPSAGVRYQSNHPLDDAFARWASEKINETIHARRSEQAGLPLDKVKGILTPVRLESKDLSRRNPETGEIEEGPEENKALSLLVPFGFMMLMFMVIMVGATPLMQGVVEEKMQRIAEVLLGSVSPFQLMMGKLLGTVGVSLTLVAVYLGGAYYAAHRYGLAEHLPADLVAWFLTFQVLSVILYGSLFIAIGAACTDMKETQSLIWPVMLLATMPMFVCFNVIREPNSTFAEWASFFPPATPMLMIARQAVPPGISSWQPALGVVLVLLTALACVYAAGRIFRVGILMQGKGAKISEMMRWVISG